MVKQCSICKESSRYKIKGKDICVHCDDLRIMKEIGQYVRDHKKEYYKLDPEQIEKNEFYHGMPMLKSEIEKLNFLIDEYGIEHLLVHLILGYNETFIQRMKLYLSVPELPTKHLYSMDYLKPDYRETEDWEK